MRIVDKMSPFSVEEGDTIFLEIGELEVVSVDPVDEGYNISLPICIWSNCPCSSRMMS